MTAAEKYAELEAQGLERPVCERHGATQSWSKAKDFTGGRWRCSQKAVERYRANPRKYIEKASQWAAKNPERVAQIKQRHHENNRGKRRASNREWWRRDRGWYDEGGMATKPMQAKELI